MDKNFIEKARRHADHYADNEFNYEPSADWYEVRDAEFARLIAEKAKNESNDLFHRAIESINDLIMCTPSEVTRCHGDKCREVWCASCNSDAEDGIDSVFKSVNNAVEVRTKIENHLNEIIPRY